MAVTVEYAEGGLCRIAVDGEMTIFTALTLKLVDQLSVYLGGGANARALVKAAQVPAEYERPHTTQGGVQKVQSHMEGEASQPIGDVLVKQHMVQLPVVDAALEKQKQRKDSKAAEASLIRVDAANAVLEIPAAEMAPPPSFGAHIRAAS